MKSVSPGLDAAGCPSSVNSIRELYVRALTLVERSHRRLPDVIKEEFAPRGRTLQPEHFARGAWLFSLLLPSKAKGADLSRPAEAPDPGRDHSEMVGDIIAERWARSSRNDGRLHPESPANVRAIASTLFLP